MLARTFRSNQPAVLLAVLPLVPLVLWPAAIRPRILPEVVMPFATLVHGWLPMAGWVPAVAAVLVVVLIGVQLASMAHEAELLGDRTHLPALLLPLLLGVLAQGPLLDEALLGMPLALVAMRRCWAISGGGPGLRHLFDAGMLLGLSALFHLPYVFLVAAIWASVSIIRPFHWREYIVPVLSLVLTFYLAWAILHVLPDLDWSPMASLSVHAQGSPGTVEQPAYRSAILYGTLGVMLVIATLRYWNTYQRGVMREKNLRASFMAFLATLAVLVVFARVLNGASSPVLVAARPNAV